MAIIEATPFLYGVHETATLPDSYRARDITSTLGVGPVRGPDDGRVAWSFTINGKQCAIWRSEAKAWSAYDPENTLSQLFPGIAYGEALGQSP